MSRHLKKIIVGMFISCGTLPAFALTNPIENRQDLSSRRLTDTLPFTSDSLSGWASYYSYLAIISDSVELELILYRNNTDQSVWSAQSRVGIISAAYSPTFNQVVDYKEGNRMWRIYVFADGNCWFNLLAGPPPSEHPPVVPIQIRYKK